MAFGTKEDRNITTVEACANAGITVQSLTSNEVTIIPQAYKIAITLGTTDYKTIQDALNKANSYAVSDD